MVLLPIDVLLSFPPISSAKSYLNEVESNISRQKSSPRVRSLVESTISRQIYATCTSSPPPTPNNQHITVLENSNHLLEYMQSRSTLLERERESRRSSAPSSLCKDRLLQFLIISIIKLLLRSHPIRTRHVTILSFWIHICCMQKLLPCPYPLLRMCCLVWSFIRIGAR